MAALVFFYHATLFFCWERVGGVTSQTTVAKETSWFTVFKRNIAFPLFFFSVNVFRGWEEMDFSLSHWRRYTSGEARRINISKQCELLKSLRRVTWGGFEARDAAVMRTFSLARSILTVHL